MSTSLLFGKCDSLRMFEEMQTALDEIIEHAVEGVVDLAEAICPAIGDYLSWELTEPSLHFAFEEEVLPPNIATVFTTTPSVLLDWISAAQEIVMEHAARAA